MRIVYLLINAFAAFAGFSFQIYMGVSETCAGFTVITIMLAELISYKDVERRGHGP